MLKGYTVTSLSIVNLYMWLVTLFSANRDGRQRYQLANVMELSEGVQK